MPTHQHFDLVERESVEAIKLKNLLSGAADQIDQLITNSAFYYAQLEEIKELKERIRQLEQDQQRLLKSKSTEYCKEVETETLVKLAMKLAPIFGLTTPENYEDMVRQYIKSMQEADWNEALMKTRRTKKPNW